MSRIYSLLRGYCLEMLKVAHIKAPCPFYTLPASEPCDGLLFFPTKVVPDAITSDMEPSGVALHNPWQ